MTFEADLRTHLSESSITSYVGERIQPVIRQEDGTLPALTYMRVAGVPQTDLDGDDGNLLNIRIQIDVWSRSHDESKVIAEAVRLRMQTAAASFRSVMVIDEDFYEDETRLHRVSMDFSCWYRTA